MRSGCALAILAVALIGCGPDPLGDPNRGGRSTTITVNNNFFDPTPDTVAPGQILFSWSTPSNGHNVSWLTGPGTLPLNSSTQTSGTHQVTLTAGIYTYHCTVHSGMNGKIVVQ